ncbi:MAG: HNH endonuclease [Planctomycetes bacterium]|jgi:5-methylcytosine-specific restriction endonuclease McrA|nr:HNH endonuclease [Planctomycetota bacterium]
MRLSDDARKASLLERATLVLNRSWRPVHVTTVRRALCMVFRDAARIVAPDTLSTYTFEEWLQQPVYEDRFAIRSPSVRMAAPEIIVLSRYDRVPCHEAPFTRRNLFLRDDFTCQYCGRRCNSDHLSVDHVLPRSRGGATSWENCVLACIGCNARKADRTLKEVGFRLLRPPVRPRWTPYLTLRPNQRMDSWAQFAPEAKRRTTGSS